MGIFQNSADIILYVAVGWGESRGGVVSTDGCERAG